MRIHPSQRGGDSVGSILATSAGIAVLDGPEPGPADAAAALNAIFRFGRLALKALGVSSLATAITSDQAPQPEFFNHFTDEAGRAGVSRTGTILPSANGFVFLTPTVFSSGAAARSALALSRTPTGLRIVRRSGLSRSGNLPLCPIPGGSQPGATVGGGFKPDRQDPDAHARGLHHVRIGHARGPGDLAGAGRGCVHTAVRAHAHDRRRSRAQEVSECSPST